MKYILLVILLSFVLIGCAVKEDINPPAVIEGDVLVNQTPDAIINVTYLNDTTLIIINYTYNNTVNTTNSSVGDIRYNQSLNTTVNVTFITQYVSNKTKVNGS